MTSLQNPDGLLDSFTFFVSQNYRNYLVSWHRLAAELVSHALARDYSHGVTSFQNLDGLLGSFTFFVSQNYLNYLVGWHRLIVELGSEGPPKVYD